MIMGKRRRPPVCEEVVKPSGAGVETRLVLLAALLTVVISGSAIVLRNTSASAKVVPDWRVDAFSDLRAGELAVFNALYTAAPEIELYHEDGDGHWPSVDELAADLVPPFVKDAAWETSGGMEWNRSVIASPERHIALYVGHPSRENGTGSFMLIMLHDHVKKEGNAGAATHAPYEVWVHPSPVAEVPVMVTDRALIGKGWREVVARKGADETPRAKEEFVQ